MNNPRKFSVLGSLFVALVLILAVGSIAPGVADAAADDLFISEYIEGSSFNKAIEIYNGTGGPVDLGAGEYSLELYSNGASSPSQSADLTGSIADGDVFVLAHASADPAILAVADATNSAVINFNGDDAVVLRKGSEVIDAFGQIGVDPGSEWPGGGVDDTLRRKVDLCAGDTDATDAFDASVEWDSFAQNTFDGLGSHTANCDNGGGPAEPVINEFSASTTGTDVEYVEIFGDSSTDYSAYTVLEIEGDGAGAGTVDEVIALGTTDANGFYLANLPANALENGTISLLLVSNFAGAQGEDLDSDNDGTLDSTPWDALIDSVAVDDGDTGDITYGTPALGPNYDGVSSFAPGGASRIPDGFDTDSASDWVRNDFDLAGIPGFTGTPDSGEAFNTPGEANELVPPSYDLVINEIHADPDTANGDANGDGTSHFSQDEFVELVNNSDDDLDISGWTLSDGFGVRHVFPEGSVVSANCAIVIFGGGSPSGGFGGAVVQTASSGQLGLNNDGDTVTIRDAQGNEAATYTYGSEGGDNQSLTRDPDITGPEPLILHSTATGSGGALFSPGTLIDGSNFAGCTPPLTIGACGDPATFIHEVQGNGLASPLDGQTVVVEGVVVGDFQNIGAADNGDLNGFHLQEEDLQADADPASSEGVFIYAPGISTDVANGDVVRVLGDVSEFNEMTEITASEIVTCGSDAHELVSPATVSLPVDNIDDLEAYEGMSVTFPQALVISEYFNFDRFGEIVLTTDRQFQPTAIYEPGSPEAAALADLNRRSRIMLDDGRTNQNPDPAIHPNGAEFTLDNLFRGGDTVANVTGVLDYSFGLYRVQPTAGADYTPVNLRPELPEDVGGDIQVASFNVLNYFTTLDVSGNLCGPPGFEQECRGANTVEELERQRAKIVAAIADMDAEVVGLIEIQNDEGASTADLVQALNSFLGDDVYAYIDTGFIGTDAIKQAFIYQPAEVTPVGDFAVLDTDAFVDPMETGEGKNRPALAQTFMDNDGGVVTVVVNHLKSKGSDCGGPPDDDPEQGNCNLTRTLAAQMLAGWLATDPTGSGDADFLIIGDLNAYDKEDPIDALIASGYTDLIAQYGGEFAYSYVFDGQLGYLDHGLANANLASQVTGATVWHINADEADLIDYDMSFKQDAQDAIYNDDEFRSSDHDPVIVGLALNGSPNCSGAVPSVFSLWPPNHEFYSIDVLGVTDPEGDPITITIDSIFQDEAVDADESGNTAPDGMGVGTSTAQVRAERVGTGGNGRVYHIFFTATDGQGGSCSGEVLVSVPVGRHMAAIDDGALFDSTAVPE